MGCPVCGLPLRPDHGESVEPVVTPDRVYTAHAGACAAALFAALVELGDVARVRRRPSVRAAE